MVFDIGMIKLEIDLQDRSKGINKVFDFVDDLKAWPYYDWEENRLKIFMSSFTSPFNKANCLLGIKAIHNVVKAQIAIQGHSIFAGYFAHEGYVSPRTPEAYKKDLDKLMEINFSMKGGSCKISLTSDQVYYSD
tara:strand:- start:498 stop:899 length:402 start_codon:yes stop_codon:yes gene_type:complete